MIASEDDRSRETAVSDGVVERLGNSDTAFFVGVQDAGLGSDDHGVLACFANPSHVIEHLLFRFLGCVGGHGFHDLGGDGVGGGEVGWAAARAYPSKWAKPIIEAHGSHDIFHIRRVAESAIVVVDGSTGASSFQQKGVAIIPEIHSSVGKRVDGVDLTSQGFAHEVLEAFRVFGHAFVGLFEGESDGVIAAGEGVMQRCLVRAEFDFETGFGDFFP